MNVAREIQTAIHVGGRLGAAPWVLVSHDVFGVVEDAVSLIGPVGVFEHDLFVEEPF